MIGKVLRGSNVGRLLYYLYGPGRANEHADPHLVAGFADPAYLEPGRRRGGVRDFRRLTGLLTQPLAALAQPGYDRPVWHCALRAAPGDRLLSDQEWAEVAGLVMERTGLARGEDLGGVRWVAVRHAADHVHLVATLARQDGARPRIWNDFYRVRQACLEAEEQLGLTVTAPADRTAARRPTRAETEQATRRGWTEPPRATLRRAVAAAAAGAGNDSEFFDRLREAGLLVRQRSGAAPGTVTGYAVGLPRHRSADGEVIWYSGGKLAADLTLPHLRARWTPPRTAPEPGATLPPPAARAVLRSAISRAADHAQTEAEFFARLRQSDVLVRLRYSHADPGQVTGYSAALPGYHAPGGALVWHSGGRLGPHLTLPRLRARWYHYSGSAPERSGAPVLTAPERSAIYQHAARQAATAAEHIRNHARDNPAAAADAAWATADCLHAAARALRSPALRQAADDYDRAARAPHRQIPRHTTHGDSLRTTARLITLLAPHSPGGHALVTSLAALTTAVTDLRHAQHHAAQAAAARAAASHLYTELHQLRTATHQPSAMPTIPQPPPAPAPSKPRTARPPLRGRSRSSP